MAAVSDQQIFSAPEHVYLNNCFPSEPSITAQDDKLADMLWDLTTDMIKLKQKQPM